MSSTASSNRGIYFVGTGLVVVALVLVVALSAFRHRSEMQERRSRVAAVNAGPYVRTATVMQSPGTRTITLTGETRPFLSVTLYSKVSGYLKNVLVDKGDHVAAGQTLAVVESPETDQEYDAAVADAQNKRVIASRDAQLIGRKLIAPEEAEQSETDAKVAESRVARLATLKSYESLRAPFAGTVTARFADPGALVQNAENAQTSALPVVTVSETDSLRVYIYVAQRDAADVRRGAPVTIADPSRPGVALTGVVTRYTDDLDPNTRTLLAEIDVSNRRAAIVPGGFVQVAVRVTGPQYLEVPANAIVARGAKSFVAVITPNQTVTYREVHIADTDGETVRLIDGVAPGERVALDLGDSVIEGQHVQPVGDVPVGQTT